MSRSGRFALRLTPGEKVVWSAAASRAGQSLSEFVRSQVNDAVKCADGHHPQASSEVCQSHLDRPAAPAATRAKPSLCAVCSLYGMALCPDCRAGQSLC
jgi:hypothetical protein